MASHHRTMESCSTISPYPSDGEFEGGEVVNEVWSDGVQGRLEEEHAEEYGLEVQQEGAGQSEGEIFQREINDIATLLQGQVLQEGYDKEGMGEEKQQKRYHSRETGVRNYKEEIGEGNSQECCQDRTGAPPQSDAMGHGLRQQLGYPLRPWVPNREANLTRCELWYLSRKGCNADVD